MPAFECRPMKHIDPSSPIIQGGSQVLQSSHQNKLQFDGHSELCLIGEQSPMLSCLSSDGSEHPGPSAH
jgi:hypothetical protein